MQVLLQPLSIEKDRVFVNPPEVSIGEGESRLLTVQWKNDTGKVVWLWIPNGDQYFKTPSKNVIPAPIPSDPENVFLTPILIKPGEDILLEVKAEPDKARTQYHVYCEAINHFAEGNSPPVVKYP
jgi:hypothetical protein